MGGIHLILLFFPPVLIFFYCSIVRARMTDVIRALADGFRARCGLRRTSPSFVRNEQISICSFLPHFGPVVKRYYAAFALPR